jgi:hypothetical protein
MGADLLFVNRRGRPFSANKLLARALHPLLVKLGISLVGSTHCATVLLLPFSQTAQPRLWCRSSYGTATHGSRSESTPTQ